MLTTRVCRILGMQTGQSVLGVEGVKCERDREGNEAGVESRGVNAWSVVEEERKAGSWYGEAMRSYEVCIVVSSK